MIGNVLSNNYDEYKSNGDRNKALPIKEYIGNIKPYLKNITNNLDWCKENLFNNSNYFYIFKRCRNIEWTEIKIGKETDEAI